MYPFLRIGSFLIQLSGLSILAGVWIAILIIEREAPRSSLDKDAISSIISSGLVAGVVGARVGFVLLNLEAYLNDFWSVFALDIESVSPEIGLIVGLVVSLYLWQRSKLPALKTLDVLVSGYAVVAIAVALANLLNGNAYGMPTDLPWAIYLWGEYRHPTQIYSLILNLAILFVILRYDWHKIGNGIRFLVFIMLSFGANFVLEGFRGDSIILADGLRLNQMVAFVIVLSALGALKKWLPKEAVKS